MSNESRLVLQASKRWSGLEGSGLLRRLRIRCALLRGDPTPQQFAAFAACDKRLVNQWAADHTTTLAGGRPILALDMYEHAYQMDYGVGAARYVDVFMDAIRWDNVTSLYDQYSRQG